MTGIKREQIEDNFALFYRRNGKPINGEGAALIWAEEIKNKHVALTDLKWGGQVSTVFLGIDHNFLGNGPPLIFETMVFPLESFCNLDLNRYSTEAQALKGHQEMVKKWGKKNLKEVKHSPDAPPKT